MNLHIYVYMGAGECKAAGNTATRQNKSQFLHKGIVLEILLLFSRMYVILLLLLKKIIKLYFLNK